MHKMCIMLCGVAYPAPSGSSLRSSERAKI